MEAELGVVLFERKGRNLRINRYGTLFAKRVERILQVVERGKNEIEEYTNPESGCHPSFLFKYLGCGFNPTFDT
ncbi:hypothetical protein [Paenibacillus qinlingensis]|uniref:hypothetical protein n=1 Tax=Paenibacillus qinlingensis TaxID=1837343 RepID=UPI00286C2296|nr:hypothetical protein [Paenibacillus qinlingensis]